MDFKMDTSLNEKGGKIMRKRRGKKSLSILDLLALAAFALTFQLGAVGALAQTTDTDNDGFTNTIETSGFPLPPGMSINTYPSPSDPTKMPNCTTSGGPRDQCVDPATKDLFVIIKRGATGCPPSTICNEPCQPTFVNSGIPSDIPMPPYSSTNLDPLALVRAGLGVTTHELIQTIGTSQAIGDYYAVKIVEDLNPCGAYMGFSTFGTFAAPYTGGIATVWPERIKNWITQTCSQACFTDRFNVTTCYKPNDAGVMSFLCKNANSTTSVNMKSPDPALVSKLNGEFLQNIINHEVSHLIHLASASGTVDHHYPIAQGVLMEQFIGTKVTKDRSNNINVILYLSTGYTKEDKGQFWLEKP
jgi:hypothetical protein